MLHALSVDVEDWYHDSLEQPAVGRERVEANTDRLLEIFAEAGALATFFVLGQVAERHPQLVRRIAAAGHEIGSHSHSHALLPQCTADELRAEIEGSKLKLESALGTPMTTFCYPNGSTDQRSVALVREAGYRAGVTTQWGSNARGDDPYRLQRFNMNAAHAQDRWGRFSEARLAWRMSGLQPGLTGTKQDPYSGASA